MQNLLRVIAEELAQLNGAVDPAAHVDARLAQLAVSAGKSMVRRIGVEGGEACVIEAEEGKPPKVIGPARVSREVVAR